MFFEVVNAATDIGLILLPAYVVRNVSVSKNRKASVVSVFALRLLYVIDRLQFGM